MDLLISAFININFFTGSWSSFDEVFNNILAIVLLVQLITLPLLILCYICPRYKSMKKKPFE